MEGRTHTGVVVTALSLSEVDRARSWEAAWRERRAATPAAEPGAAIAFRLAAGYELDGISHFAIYETPSERAAAVLAGSAPHETSASYTKIGSYGPLAAGRTVGVVLVFTDCTEPSEEDAFNRWYAEHLHHTVDNTDLNAATRYVSDDPSRTPSKYLAIYETQAPDPGRVQKDGMAWWLKNAFEIPKGLVGREVACERID